MYTTLACFVFPRPSIPVKIIASRCGKRTIHSPAAKILAARELRAQPRTDSMFCPTPIGEEMSRMNANTGVCCLEATRSPLHHRNTDLGKRELLTSLQARS